MAHVEALTGRFGSAALGGVLRIATQLGDDGTIRVLTPEFDVELGELDGSPSTRVDRLASAFKDAGANVTVPGTSSVRCGPSGCSSPASAPSPR